MGGVISLLKKASQILARETKYVHLVLFLSLCALFIPAALRFATDFPRSAWYRIWNFAMPFAIGIYGCFSLIFWVIPELVIRYKKKKGKDWSGVLAIANLVLIRGFIPGILGFSLLLLFWTASKKDILDFSESSQAKKANVSLVEEIPCPEKDIQLFTEYKQKAENGDVEAQFRLARLYDEGKGALQDKKEACRWYRIAADHGLTKAQFNLGWMYSHGEGVSQDYGEAIRWYTKASDQGCEKAQYNLALIYRNGQGVPQDKRKAVEYYTLAAQNGDAEAQCVLGSILDPINFDWPEIPLNREESRKWLRLAAEQGHEMAQYMMGSIYEQGIGVPYDKDEAIKWYKLAAAQGHEDSKKILKKYGTW